MQIRYVLSIYVLLLHNDKFLLQTLSDRLQCLTNPVTFANETLTRPFARVFTALLHDGLAIYKISQVAIQYEECSERLDTRVTLENM